MLRFTLGEYFAFAHDIGPVADTQGFTYVVIGNEDADIAIGELLNDALNIDYLDGVHPGKRFIEQYKTGFIGQCPCYFYSPPLAAGK